MGQAAADSQLADAARFWFAHALEMRTPGRGIAGFTAREADTWVADPGILTGAAGIGLALLAAITPIEPEWDRILLLSARD
jgi:hypothetical protein